MSYIQTVNEIRAAAQAVNGDRFDHGRRVDFSQNFGKPFPYIWLYPIDMRDAGPDEVTDSATILMGFWAQDKPDSSIQHRELLIAEMDILCTQFLEVLRANKFSQVSAVAREPQYQHSQGHVSGMALRFTYQNFTPCL